MSNQSGTGDIDRTSPVPVYHQLKTMLLDEIAAGRYPPGTRLPTEHEMCAQFGISRTPVTRALRELVDEGVVIRRRRTGTIVDPSWAAARATSGRPSALVPEADWLGAVGLDLDGDVDSGILELRTCHADEVRTRLARSVAEGTAPEIALVDTADVPGLAASGFVHRLADLDDAWVVDDLAVDFPAAAAGGGYAVPAVAYLTGMWWRREVIAAGPAPATWEALMELTRSARDGDPLILSPLVMAAGGRPRAAVEAAEVLLASHGGAIVDGDGVGVTSPAARAALETLRSLVAESSMSADVAAYGSEDVVTRLGSGAAVGAIARSDLAPLIASAAGIEAGSVWDHFAFVPLPGAGGGDPAAAMGSWSFVVLRQSQDPRAALAAIRRVLTAAPQIPSPSGGLVPVRSSAVEAGMQSGVLAPLDEALHAAFVSPGTVGSAVVAGEVQRMIQAAITGGPRVVTATERCSAVVAAVTGLSLPG